VSLPGERFVRGTLAALPFLVETIGQDDPTLLLIGEAVGAVDAPALGPALRTGVAAL
jgi:uroporphyrin-III C-methyltransferase